MPLPRSILPFLSVILLAVVVAACGSDPSDGGADPSGEPGPAVPDGRDPDSPGDGERPERGPGSAERTEGAAGGGVAISPAVTACLERAGFTPAPSPPAGAIAAWRAKPGATVAVTPSVDDARALATRLGDVASPASATGRIAAVGPPELRDAGVACLKPVTEDA